MEIPVRKIDRGYFKLSRKSPTHEFSLLIPAQLSQVWTCMRLKQWFGSDPPIRLSYIVKRTDEPTGRGSAYPVTIVQLVSNKLEKEIYRRLETNTAQGALLDWCKKGEL